MNIKNEPIKITHVTIFENGSGFISIKCAGRYRMLYFDNGELEIGTNVDGSKRFTAKNIKETSLGTLGTENSFFPQDKCSEMYPEKWGILDLFGMGVGV